MVKCIQCGKDLAKPRTGQRFCARGCSSRYHAPARRAAHEAEVRAKMAQVVRGLPYDSAGVSALAKEAPTFKLGGRRFDKVPKWFMCGARAPITTRGTIRRAAQAWVYVGEVGLNLTKIGMSANPAKRCHDLGVRFHAAVAVVPLVAKQVETETLRLLGHKIGDGEYTIADPETALRAVRRARDIVGRYTRADPALTDEEARQQRIAAIA